MLVLVCVVIIPIPVGTVRQALSDILLVTPADLKARVDAIAADAVQRHRFVSYRAYVAKVGRSEAGRRAAQSGRERSECSGQGSQTGF